MKNLFKLIFTNELFVYTIIAFSIILLMSSGNTGFLVSACLLVLIIFLFIMSIRYLRRRYLSKKERQENQKIISLREKYKSYVSVVESSIPEILRKIGFDSMKELEDQFLVKEKQDEYLIKFDEYLNYLTVENNLLQKPNIFLISSCMMYALIEKPIYRSKYAIPELKAITENVNFSIAFEVALNILEEPVTYYSEKLGIKLEKNGPKNSITIPKGVLGSKSLRDSILKTLRKDSKDYYYVSQMANMFHLIYLYNCKQ